MPSWKQVTAAVDIENVLFSRHQANGHTPSSQGEGSRGGYFPHDHDVLGSCLDAGEPSGLPAGLALWWTSPGYLLLFSSTPRPAQDLVYSYGPLGRQCGGGEGEVRKREGGCMLLSVRTAPRAMLWTWGKRVFGRLQADELRDPEEGGGTKRGCSGEGRG